MTLNPHVWSIFCLNFCLYLLLYFCNAERSIFVLQEEEVWRGSIGETIRWDPPWNITSPIFHVSIRVSLKIFITLNFVFLLYFHLYLFHDINAHSFGLRHRLTILIVYILLNCWANIELWLSYLHYSVCIANMTVCAMQIWGQQQLSPMFALYTVEPTPLPLKSGLWVVFPLVLVHKPLPLPPWDTTFHSILLAWPHIPDFEVLVKI